MRMSWRSLAVTASLAAGSGAAALGGAAAPLTAQGAELTIGAAHMADPSGAGRSGLRIAPSFGRSAPRGAWRAGASVFLAEGDRAWVGAGADANATVAASGRVAATVEASAAAETVGDGLWASAARFAPAARIAGASWGASAGPVLGVSYAREAAARESWPRLPFGAADERGAASRALVGCRATAWAASGRSGGAAAWSASSLDGAAWREASLRLRHRAGALELEASGGMRHGALDDRWVSGSVSLRLREPLTVTAALGGHPSDPLVARAGGSFAALSLSYSPGRGAGGRGPVPPARVAPPPRVVTVSIAAPRGAEVTIAGDWNRWTPERLARRPDGRYAADLTLPAGTYRFIVRVNGEARVPDGYPSESDAFGGRSALLRVPPGS